MYTETARSLFIKKAAVRHPVQIIHNVLTIITAVIIQWIWDKIVNSLIKLPRLSGSGTLDLSSVAFAAIFQNGHPVRVSLHLNFYHLITSTKKPMSVMLYLGYHYQYGDNLKLFQVVKADLW